MQNRPLFSVLIANYNGGRFLRECIDSVLKQTYTNWEIILVDDGSSDNSQSIYNAFAHDERIKIFKRNENQGCTYTKAECIKYAKGNLCGFLDSDDILAPHALEYMVKAHINPLVSIVSSRYKIINEHGDVIGENRLLDLRNKSYLETRDYSPEHFVSFKKSAYDMTKGLDIIHKLGDDQELYLLLEEVGEWIVLDKMLYYYRINNTSVSKIKTFECYFWNIIVRYEACVRRGINPDRFALQDYRDALEEYANHQALERENQIRSSKAYRLGKMLLRPFKWLRKLDK